MADHKRVRPSCSAAYGFGEPSFLRTGHQVIDEHAEPSPRAGPELVDHVDKVVDATEMLDHDSLGSQVIAPHLLNELGVVAVFDAHHRADISGLRVLDDHAEFYWQLSGPEPLRAVRIAGQQVRTVTIIHPSDPRNDGAPNSVRHSAGIRLARSRHRRERSVKPVQPKLNCAALRPSGCCDEISGYEYQSCAGAPHQLHL
jgi:hypothetical protein